MVSSVRTSAVTLATAPIPALSPVLRRRFAGALPSGALKG
jgi:hypothetical protein